MANADSPANAVLQALGFALFVRESSGALRAAAGPPLWLKTLWPAVGSGEEPLDSGVSPFLENFLIDAEECWSAGGEQRARSGPWIEQDAQANNVQLEATALTLEGRSVLLLERLGEAFEAKKSMLQKARENVIAYQRLNSEIQKKEILLHCVAEDMTAALANVVTSLRLLELENNSPKSRQLLGLAARATEEQQTLIHKVLAVFAEELTGLFGQNGETENESDLFATIQNVVGSVALQSEEKNVRLTSLVSAGREVRVPLDPGHLERVIGNLIENAFEQTPAGGEIAIGVDDEAESVVLSVEDNGTAASPDACDNLFSKLEPAAALGQGRVLRLHFCRMMIEGCGGEIGCGARASGGNRFWIRLPKIAK